MTDVAGGPLDLYPLNTVVGHALSWPIPCQLWMGHGVSRTPNRLAYVEGGSRVKVTA